MFWANGYGLFPGLAYPEFEWICDQICNTSFLHNLRMDQMRLSVMLHKADLPVTTTLAYWV